MNCPMCDVTLQRSERQGVEIDFCPRCRGVWLDRGELDKIIELAGEELVAMTAGGTSPAVTSYLPKERRQGELSRKPHRHKGLLRDLFD